MTPLEVYLAPGRYVLGILLTGYLEDIDPTLIAVLSGLVSWFIWISIIRVAWAVTLRMFGFEPRRRF